MNLSGKFNRDKVNKDSLLKRIDACACHARKFLIKEHKQNYWDLPEMQKEEAVRKENRKAQPYKGGLAIWRGQQLSNKLQLTAQISLIYFFM